MPNPEDIRKARQQDASDTFSAWLRDVQAGGEADFNQLCANRPELAGELQKLYSAFELCRAAATSRSFHQKLQDEFGDIAEVTVQLEEGHGVPPSGGVASVPAEAGTPNQTGRYALEDEVAHGGMGVIWRVRDRDLSRTLAMKVMTGAPGTSAATDATSRINLARFLEEAQVTAQLDHPGIVPVHEVGFDAQGQPFFIMKLVKGRDLNEIFKLARAEQEGWNLPRAVGVVVKACQALAYAHSKGVLHRDLKPANIMVGRFGEVYVMDWGLAKITGRKDLHDIRPQEMQLTSVSVHSKRREEAASTPDSPLITMDGSVVGTPAYMPPEQAQGQVEEVDPLSDVYSLGAILYNLLTGQAPYMAPGARISPHTILGMVIQGPPKPVQQLNPQSPPELIAICEKAMAREKRARYQSSLDLAEDLQAFLDHRVVRAYRTGAVAEFKSWIARNKLAALTGAAAVVLVVSFLLFDSVRERANALRLKHNLAQQYLRRGDALCESGEVARGLHWFARALDEAPAKSTSLRAVIRENLAAWSQDLNSPVALLQHDTLVRTAAYSPDGTRVVTGGHDGVVRLWSAATGEPLGEPMIHEGFATALAFSPDGKTVLTTSQAGSIGLWSADTGKSLKPPMRHEGALSPAVFSPDGRRVLSASGDHTARLWSAETGQPIGPPLRHEDIVLTVAFSPDGTRALTGSRDKTARLWSLEGAGPVSLVMRHEEAISHVMFSPGGGLVITVCEETVHFWSAATGQPVGSPLRHGAKVRAFAFSPDGRRAVTGGLDNATRLWSVETRQTLGALMWHQGRVNSVAFTPDGKSILTGSDDKTVRLWSGETGEALSSPLFHANGVNQVLISPDGTRLLTRAGNAAVLWSLRLGRESVFTALASSSPIISFAFSPDGKRLAGGSVASSHHAQMWLVDTGQRVGSFMNHEGRVWAVAFSSDGKFLLTGSEDKTARLWSGETGEPLGAKFVHEADVRCVALSPDGKLAATGSFDKTARLWSTKTGQPVGPPLIHSNFVEEVVFSPDGENLLTACGDGAARLWSVPTGKLLLPPMRHRGALLAAAFSPDGNLIATGGRDYVVRFWDTGNGRLTGPVLEHPDWVEHLCFTANGRRLWTLGQGSRLWDVETGEPLGPTLLGWGFEFALSPDGTRLAVANEQAGKVRLLAPSVLDRDLKHAALWVQVLTWTEMGDQGALNWLDAPTRRARSEELQKLGGPKIQ